MVAWDGGKLWDISSGLALFLPVRTTESLVCAGSRVNVNLNSEKGVIAREEGPFLSMKVTRTRAVGYLRCESGPHLHEVVTGKRGGEAKLPLAVEVEFRDETETCVSAGWTLWRSGGGHSWMVNQRIEVGVEVLSCRNYGLALTYLCSLRMTSRSCSSLYEIPACSDFASCTYIIGPPGSAGLNHIERSRLNVER